MKPLALTLTLTLALTLSACVETQNAIDQAARAPAEKAVTEAMFTQFPQVPKELVQPFAACVMRNATNAEIGALAREAVIGVTARTADIIKPILARPETAQCLTATAPTPGLTL